MPSESDDLPPMDEFLNEYAIMAHRHGHLGAWSRLSRKYIGWIQVARFGLFICAFVGLTYGAMQRPIPAGPFSVRYLSPLEAAGVALFAMVVMAAVWKLWDHVRG